MKPTETERARATLFVRAISLLFLMALLSVMAQLDLLLGAQGLLPAVESLSTEDPTRPPTLFSLSASDGALWTVVGLGALGALLASLGRAQRVGLAAAWLAFYSVSVAGSGLFDFVADALLIQLGLVAMAMLWVPDSPWPRRVGALLICKVMLESGLHKLLDVTQDTGWLNGGAMGSFFEVAAIPGPLAPLADALPQPILLLAGWMVLFIEVVGPFLLLAGARLRRLIIGSWIGLMAGIILTANFGVLPYAMLAATLLLFEERWVERIWARLSPWLGGAPHGPKPSGPRARDWVRGLSLALILCSTAQVGLDLFTPPGPGSPTVWLHSWRVSTPFSMFRRIPLERMEMQFEVEVDGEWREAHVAQKVGLIDAHPGLVAPHHPRLPFLLWFQATLGRGLPDLTSAPGAIVRGGNEQQVRGSSGASQRVARSLARALCDPGDPRRAAFSHAPEGSASAVRAMLWSYRFGRGETTWSRELVQRSQAVTCENLQRSGPGAR